MINPAVARGRRPQALAATRRKAGGENRRPPIRIAGSIVILALLWYASFRTVTASRGVINVAAKAVFLVLTSLACIVIGFLLPLVPGLSAVIGGAFWAGSLASAGALAGMTVSDAILAQIALREAVAAGPAEAGEETKPGV